MREQSCYRLSMGWQIGVAYCVDVAVYIVTIRAGHSSAVAYDLTESKSKILSSSS